MTEETKLKATKPARRNILYYDEFVPENMKGEFCEVPEALPAVMKAMLFAFIEGECENGEVEYQPKPDTWNQKEFERGLDEGKPNIYRGLTFRHVIDGSIVAIVDLYWWFKVESPNMLREMNSERKKVYGVSKFIDGKRKNVIEHDPDFTPKFDKKQLLWPENYMGAMDREKLVELVHLSPAMWT